MRFALSTLVRILTLILNYPPKIREHFSELYVITVKRLSPSDPGKKEIVNGVLRDAKSNRVIESVNISFLIIIILLRYHVSEL